MQKMSARSIVIYRANLATFDESYIFGGLRRPDAIWCDIKFYAHHFFSTLRIFYVQMPTGRKQRTEMA